MAIISFDPDSYVDYIPEYNDNRKSDDPCIIQIKFVSFGRMEKYRKVLSSKLDGNSSVNEVADASSALQKQQFTESIGEISGFKVGDEAVTDGGRLYEVADKNLIYELIGAMEDQQKLSEGQRKN